MSTQALEEFLTVSEVAELLSVAPRTVYDWVYRGIIPYRKAGRRTIFLWSEIEVWTKKNNTQNEPSHGDAV